MKGCFRSKQYKQYKQTNNTNNSNKQYKQTIQTNKQYKQTNKQTNKQHLTGEMDSQQQQQEPLTAEAEAVQAQVEAPAPRVVQDYLPRSDEEKMALELLRARVGNNDPNSTDDALLRFECCCLSLC